MPKDVLVVDDEPKLCGALSAFFETKGFHVTTAATAQSALDQIHGMPTGVVVLDLRLPDGSGLDVLSRIKQQFPDMRVVVMSALTDQDTIREATQRGASHYLTKPLDFTSCFYAAIGIETVDLSAVQPTPEAISRVPVSVAQRYGVVPLRVSRGRLELAMTDPLDVQRLDELSALLGCDLQPVAAMGGGVAEAIRQHYGVGAGVSKRTDSPRALGAPGVPPTSTGPSIEENAGIVRLVNDLIQHAVTHRSTDLHLGIGPEGPWVRERIDGVLYDIPVAQQLGELYSQIVSRLKVMAGIDIAEHRLPQDGRIWFELGSTRLDLRLSVLPTSHGESVGIRLLEPSRLLHLEQLGLSEEQRAPLIALLAKPTGLLLVTGPTGSGKSTSLYAFLSKLNTGQINIVTIEDPVEHELPGVTQIQMQPKVGLTFATGLRSILRHDPDVIMVGEIRDQETASLAVRASLTGHLVLSTLHTNDAASGITRLLDLGIEPFLLCSTLSGIISQRLVRMLCQHCRESVQVDAKTLTSIGLAAESTQSGPIRIWRAGRCKSCRETGYHGRIGVFELLVVDHHIRSLMLKRTSSVQIRQSAVSRGMSSLWHSGWRAIQAGVTSLEELTRVLPSELH